MTAIWMRARGELRSSWRSLVALSLILAVAGGVVVFAVAGARRTDTAYTRMVGWANPPDLVSAGGFGYSRVDLSKAAKLPQVAASALVHQVGFYPTTPSGTLVPVGDGAGQAVATSRDLAVLGRSKLLEGRHANPNRPDEIEVGWTSNSFFPAHPVHPGTRVVFHFWKPGVNFLQYYHGETPEPFARVPKGAFGFSVPMLVVGITVMPQDIPEAPFGDLTFTPAFWQKYGARTFSSDGLAVQLRHGQADASSFHDAVTALSQGGHPQLSTISQALPIVQHFLHPQALALWLFAALAALAAALVFGQALARTTFIESRDYPTLRSLGMSPGQLFGVGMIRAAAVGVAGAFVAVLLAVLLSPFMPIGKAQLAEPHPGFSFDWKVLAVGWLALVIGALVLGTIPALRSARAAARAAADRERIHPSVAAATAARAGMPPTVVTGVRMALDPGRGRAATPVVSALIAAVFAIAALTTAFGFASGFQRLLTQPRLAGWNWDLGAGIPFTGDLRSKLVAPLESSPVVAGLSEANDSASVTLQSGSGDNTATGALAVQPVVGTVVPTMLSGRWPRTPSEIALGESTTRALHAHVGQSVRLYVGKRSATMAIVGTAAFINATGTSTGPGDGAGLTLDGLRRVTSNVPVNLFFIDVKRGVSITQARTSLGPILRRAGVSFLTTNEGVSTGDVKPVRTLPLFLAGLLALAAAATLGHSLLTSIRRRRRDLAILKTIGFDRRQVRASVAWQATTMSVVALLFGILVGIAAGRWAWTLYANQIGVKPEPTVWFGAILLTLLATIVIANALAAIPGRIAARTQPAVVLRAE